MAVDSLPEGFVLNEPNSQSSLPEGFVLDQPKMGRGEAAFTTATNPFGFGDELKGGVAALTAKALGDPSKIGDLYKEARDVERDKLKQARDQYPLQSIATGIVADIGPAGKALEAAGLAAPTLKNLAVSGGAIGGYTAIGENNNPENLPSDVLIGTTIGVLGSVAVGKALEGVNKVIPIIKNLFVTNKNPAAIEKESINILSKYTTPKNAKILANKLITAEKNNRQTLLPDIASDEMQGLTRLLGKTEGSKNIINDVFSKRTAGSSRRVANAINNKISSDTYFGTLDELDAGRKAASEPFRQEAYKKGAYIPTSEDIKLANYNPSEYLKDLTLPKNPDVAASQTERILNLKKQPEFLSEKNQKLASDFDEVISDPRVKRYVASSIKDNEITAPPNSVEMLHDVRKQIDKDRTSIERSLAGPNPTSADQSELIGLNGLRKRITNIMYQVTGSSKGNPGAMEQSDKIYSSSYNLQRAQEAGRDFSKFRPEELKKYVKELAPDERDAHKIGVRESLMKNVEEVNDGSSAANKIFAKPVNRDRLKIIFDNPKEYGDFARQMTDEMRIFSTKQRILGGSRTDINLADESQIIDKVASGAFNPKTGFIRSTIDAVANSIQKINKGLNEQNAKAIAETITNRKKSIDALLKIADKADNDQQKIIQSALTNIVPLMISKPIAGNLIPLQSSENNQENPD